MARPEIKVTDTDRRLVESLGMHGIPQRQIADIVCGGVSLNTLKKHFKSELITGKAFANYLVGQALFNNAMAGDTTALIFWSKVHCGWRVQ